ncbi:N-acyl amino acid synthase, PEP-CTERM/exosortase system-associated [Geoalkalibacter ferrihydriticus]|uniref:N-acyl amino acid synthase, PEP-CTERM/exosortase system-associated n=1 Tax=Geoalkalibacter ferrihydriticus TaxID=392333 RepID=A0A1G9V7L7_9BACT|nr:GNAT family N-acyltransferase [Geoalkalibacter ferrihydriticus]SDM68057.1 N-acyl amino acid synthase, PEP-CTERM/exosortase system-associated [Geoalkalibacter ferrihydriticus]
MSFRVERVTPQDALFRDYLGVRYQVYCLERGFEDPAQYPDGIETDIYDPHAVHLAAVEEQTGQVVGSARIILDSPLGFPLEQHFKLDATLDHVDRKELCEISRLAVTKSHCQDFGIVSLLLDHLFLESGRLGLTHWYAAMAKSLAVLLRRRKMHFQEAGPEMVYHGIRIPYILDLQRMAGNSSHFACYEQDFAETAHFAPLKTARA